MGPRGQGGWENDEKMLRGGMGGLLLYQAISNETQVLPLVAAPGPGNEVLWRNLEVTKR